MNVKCEEVSSIDFSIPNSVKINVQKGLDLYKEFGRGGNPVALALARHLIKKRHY